VSLNESPVEEETPNASLAVEWSQNGRRLRPGDDFNIRGSWHAILTGWEIARQDGRKIYWRRPGKSGNGWSATTGCCTSKSGDHELLAVFSSNAEYFPGPRCGRLCSAHSKFDAYTLIHWGGDYAAAAKELARQGFGVPLTASRAAHSANGPPDPGISAKQLLTTKLPEPKYAVEGLLPEGLNLLAGKPKTGKSWMALALALAVANGTNVLGSISVAQGDVLYLALEDRRRRLKKRLQKLLGSETEGAPDNVDLRCAWKRTDEGGADDLDRWLQQHAAARLVIVDTLAKIRPRGRRSDGNLYMEDYQAIEALKTVADRHAVTMLVLTHTRKSAAEDVFDTVNGSLGLTGAADGVLVLARERGQFDAVLHVTGRDIDEREIALGFSQQSCSWTVLGNADRLRVGKSQTAVVKVLESAKGPLSPSEVAAITGTDRNTVGVMLWRMAKQGMLINNEGKYSLADCLRDPIDW
jgi:hypothetical protein